VIFLPIFNSVLFGLSYLVNLWVDYSSLSLPDEKSPFKFINDACGICETVDVSATSAFFYYQDVL
jgi:hypothetical protein